MTPRVKILTICRQLMETPASLAPGPWSSAEILLDSLERQLRSTMDVPLRLKYRGIANLIGGCMEATAQHLPLIPLSVVSFARREFKSLKADPMTDHDIVSFLRTVVDYINELEKGWQLDIITSYSYCCCGCGGYLIYNRTAYEEMVSHRFIAATNPLELMMAEHQELAFINPTKIKKDKKDEFGLMSEPRLVYWQPSPANWPVRPTTWTVH